MPLDYEPRKCANCGRRFRVIEHRDDLDFSDIPIDALKSETGRQFLLSTLCPECLEKFLGAGRRASHSTVRPSVTSSTTDRGAPNGKPKLPPLKPRPLVFKVLVFTSICAFLYSLGSRIPGLSLPNFPFYHYILFHAILGIFFIYARLSNPFLILVFAIHLGFPRFRAIFVSQFENDAWLVIVMIMFIMATQREFTFASLHLQFLKVRLPVLIALLIYCGTMSPFYLAAFRIVQEVPIPRAISRSCWKPTPENSHLRACKVNFIDGKKEAARGDRRGYRDSIDHYDMGLTVVPTDSTLRAEKAYSLVQLGQISDARESLREAQRLDPSNPTVHAVKAIMYSQSGEDELAAQSLSLAVSLATKSGYSDRVLQAQALLEKNRTKSASFLLGITDSMVRQLKKEKNEAVDWMAKNGFTEDVVQQVVELYNGLIDTHANSAELHNLLGLSYYRIGMHDKAEALLDRAAKKLNPQYGEAYLNLALFVDSDEREAVYRQAAQLDPDWRELAEYYIQLLKVQKWLGRSYWVLLAAFWAGLVFIGAALDRNRKRMGDQAAYRLFFKRLLLNFVVFFLLFAVSYGIFEYYIHSYHPVNSATHTFAVCFPFF